MPKLAESRPHATRRHLYSLLDIRRRARTNGSDHGATSLRPPSEPGPSLAPSNIVADSEGIPPPSASEAPIPPFVYPTQLQGPVAQHFSFFPTATGPMMVDPTTVPMEGSDQEHSFFPESAEATADNSDMDISPDPPPPKTPKPQNPKTPS